MRTARSLRLFIRLFIVIAVLGTTELAASASPTLSGPFEREVLVPRGEAPHDLRLFITAVKTDSRHLRSLE